MTPVWKLFAKALARDYSAANMPDMCRRFLSVDRAFDLSGVEPLCNEIWRELFRGDAEDTKIFDLGEKCAFPCDSFWLEFETVGFLVERCGGPEGGVFRVSEWFNVERDSPAPMNLAVVAGIEQADDLFQHWCADTCPDDHALYGLQAAGYVLSALAVINSPRAVRDDLPPRKLPSAKLPSASNVGMRVTRIAIDVGGTRVSARSLAHTQSPKAYHFVRSHVRRFGDGSHVTVRAHWRGDPAFGIRVGVYTVRDRREAA